MQARKNTGDDGFPTKSSREQASVERSLAPLIVFDTSKSPLSLRLRTAQHVLYLVDAIGGCNAWLQRLDASRPWIFYWILHSLNLLHEFEWTDSLRIHLDNDRIGIAARRISHVPQTMSKIQGPGGGFGGGVYQLPHIASTYAGVCALLTEGSEESYKSIDRERMLEWLLFLKRPDGGFSVHVDGEHDIRAAYCALSVAVMLNIDIPDLTEGLMEYIAKCQSYEGGFGSIPGCEAHGGYTYCGIASLCLLFGRKWIKRRQHASTEGLDHSDDFSYMIPECCPIDFDATLRWLSSRQHEFSGGFDGRTNKLEDGCYSFWVGACFHMLKELISVPVLCNNRALEEYILLACQDVWGGLRDKPTKPRDFYHTCYCLSGLSLAQSHELVGPVENQLTHTDCIFNVEKKKLERGIAYFERSGRIEI